MVFVLTLRNLAACLVFRYFSSLIILVFPFILQHNLR
nr:MAG TPA: hypothetical protein [Caudoviricetes sp.]